jgi:Planctomycete cytochrome C
MIQPCYDTSKRDAPMSVKIVGLGRLGVVLGLAAGLVVGSEVISADRGPGRVIRAAQKTVKKKTTPAKKGMTKGEVGAEETAKAAVGATPAEGSLSFKRDIAPILVANCRGCHTGTGAGLRNGKLDMSTFEKLMAGGKSGKDIIASEPDSSHLVLRIKGEETPKMPPNNGQRGFADEAKAKIEEWVKQGARLDAGIAVTDPMDKYAATLDDLRKAELAKLTPEARDKVAEQTGRERWKRASKVEPEVTVGTHFLLLSKLPKARAEKLLKTMETQFAQVNRLLSTGRTPLLGSTEKIGLYVFNETNSFVEFVRTNENQEVESGEQARARLNVESPYVVAVDPVAGGEEAAPAPARRGAGARKKKGEETVGGPERTLAGIVTEQFVVAAANMAGKPPRWVSLGLGAFVASQLESGSPYYRRLRAETAENVRIGWVPKANQALGGEAKVETTRAVGYSLLEWMAGNWPAASLNNFIHVMLEGQGKLDEAIGNCLNLNREEFLGTSQLWFSERYGRL